MFIEFQDIIKQICEQLDIECNILSKGLVIELKKDNKIKYIYGFKFDLNNHALGQILDDKYALYEVLKSNNINVIEHNIVYGINNQNEYAKGYNSIEYVKKLFNKYNNNIVLKVNDGTCGNNVEHITNIEDLESTYLKLISKKISISLCPYYDIEIEFRVIILNNEIKIMYRKEKPVVIGDGVSTIKELLVKFNYEYFKNYDEDNKNVVLPMNEEYTYDWRFNLSRGARMSEEIDDIDRKEVEKLALFTSKKLNFKFCSVDIIKSGSKYYIIEINSGVMMRNFIMQASDGFNRTYNLYKEAVIEMFKGE